MSDEQVKENLITAFISLAEAINALATSNQTAVLAEISALKDEIAKLTAIGVDIENAEAAAVAAKAAAEQASARVNTLTGHVLVVRDNQAAILAKLDALSAMVTAISATLDEVKASLPVPPVAEPEEPIDPIDPPIDEPVDPEEPTDPETPEVPEEPTEPEVPEEPSPVLPIYTMQFPDFTTGEWQGSISKQESRFIVDTSTQHKEVFKVGNVVKFSNGDRRKIVSVLDRYNKLFVGYEGPKLSPEDVGHPHTIEVFASVETPAEPSPTPEPPVADPNADLVPAFGLNLGGGGNNPWLSVINGIGNDKAGTHYAPTQEIHIKEYVKNLKPGEQWLARLPIAGERLSEKSFDPLHVRYVNEIVAMMDMIHKYNGKVVIDVHNYFRWWKKVDAPIAGRDMKSHNDHLAKGHAVWTVIGEPDSPMSVDGFADFWVKILQSPIGKHPAFFCAGLVNEPHNRSQDGVDVDTKWPLAVPKLIEAVRSVNKDCWIAVAGNFYSSAKAWNVKTAAKMANITDPSDKLLFEAHQYMDQKGDGGGSWKSLSDPVVATQGTQDWAAYVKWLKDNNRRGYCGEVGGPATAGDYLTAARKLCDELFIPNRIPCTFWMGGTGQNDDYANGMNRKDGSLKPNAAPLMERIGIMYKGYGPK